MTITEAPPWNDSVSSLENVTTNYGKTAVLICPLSQDILKTFWTGPPGETLYNRPGSFGDIIQTVPNADRLEINSTNAGLLIHKVTLEDQGIYKCTAVLNESETVDLRLEVTNVPLRSIVVENIEKHDNLDVIHGVENKTLTLTCSVDGAKPQPDITWLRSDINETLNSTSNVHRYDNGTFAVSSSVTLLANRSLDGMVFICAIDHPTLESPVENDVEIYLNLKPHIKEIDDPTITTEGFEVTISCEVFDARPAANISLYFNDEEQSRFEENIVVYNETKNMYTTSAMFHRVMNRQDDGNTVTCVVHHLAVQDTINKTWAVVVYYPPSAVVRGENVTSLSESVSLDCLSINGNPDNYTFSLWQHRWPVQSNILRELESTKLNVENDKVTLKLENLSFQDSGYYKCSVSNGIGTPGNSDYMAEEEVFIFIKDVPYVVDGHTQYLSGIDETVEIVLDVYTNVEPLHFSIATNMDTSETTAVWKIKENTRKIVGVPVYNQKILIPGFRLAAGFEVQAEKNYGDYKVVVRNDIGSTTHNFKVLPREVATTGEHTGKESETNHVVIVVGVPVVGIVAIVISIIRYSKQKTHRECPAHVPVGTKFIRKEPNNDYDTIPDPGYINPISEGQSTDAEDVEYLSHQPPKVVANYWEHRKGDEKFVHKQIEMHGMDQRVDLSGSMKMASLTMSKAPDPEQDKDNDRPNLVNLRSISIEEMPEMTVGYEEMLGNADQPDSMKQSSPHIEEVD